MRRASKILTLILVVVFLFGIFAGCDLIGKDTKKYREAVAITVGDQKITVGKLLDTFNSYYNSYYYYIAYAGWTVGDVLDVAVKSLYTQYMKVDSYTSDANHVKVAANKDKFEYAEFLTQAQLDYSVSYVRYLVFTSFDSAVLEKVEAKYELGDEEAEDTSRDFYEYDDLKGAATYAEYYLNQNFTNEDMDEYIEKYFEDGVAKFANPTADLKELYLESAKAKVDELNERVDEDGEKVDLDEYKKFQDVVYKQYVSTVKNNYGIDFDAFIKQQVEDLIISGIVNLYNYEVYKEIENTDDMKTLLKDNYDTLAAAQAAEFKIKNNYDSFVTGLSSSSFIYNVPEGHEKDYVFVKNILIPFSAKQSVKLSSLKADLGTDKDDQEWYVTYRNSQAAKIVADDFNSEKDEDGKYAKVEDLFKVVGGEVVINPECKDLSDFLGADGSVAGESKADKDATIHDLMARFNTDTAQHSSLYSYVVRVNAPDNYKHQWVDEFVQATEAAMEKGGEGHYGIGVSDYGVHIVYVEGYVTADKVDFTNNYLDTKSTEYRLFKSYFETQSSKLLSEDVEKLTESYKDKVHDTNVFKKFLKENKIDYDLAESLADDED